MTDPTPESLALVERFWHIDFELPEGTWRRVAAQYIDAHVAERTAFIRAAKEYNERALRAAADAVAASLDSVLTQSIVRSYGDPDVIEPAHRRLRTYRDLTERLPKDTAEHKEIQASLDGAKSP